ncbi:MAG: class I SAM-dependent methyltransferase [Saprospiraceae bacterium]|nr:class I SAM-dependent methyltransferase [Saprospiraceae bacterium]
MYEFHKDKKRYFDFQYRTARDYILPFIAEFFPSDKTLRVLEVGCAEAGVLKAFVEQGHQCTGIELSESRTTLARQFQAEAVASGELRFLNKNIYDIDGKKDLEYLFDLIILKDVIEHIPDQQRVLGKLKEFLAEDGKMFFGFPPWQMPFGGHQQICENKLLKALPWYHLLPRGLYHSILKAAGEKPSRIEELLEIKDTGISIGQFEKYCRANDLSIFKSKYFFTNPIYHFKFGLPVIAFPNFLGKIPFIRNFYITASYYVVG